MGLPFLFVFGIKTFFKFFNVTKIFELQFFFKEKQVGTECWGSCRASAQRDLLPGFPCASGTTPESLPGFGLPLHPVTHSSLE